MSALAWYTVSWMKLVSYMQVNCWCRKNYQTRAHARGEPGELTSAVSLPQVRCSNSVEEKMFLIHAASPNKKAKRLVQYPDNLNVKDLIYFFFAPTLCYELNFPRNDRIRKIFLLRRLLESVSHKHVHRLYPLLLWQLHSHHAWLSLIHTHQLFIVNMLIAIIQQWLIPTVLGSLQPFHDMAYPLMIERVLMLAVSSHMTII